MAEVLAPTMDETAMTGVVPETAEADVLSAAERAAFNDIVGELETLETTEPGFVEALNASRNGLKQNGQGDGWGKKNA